MAKKRKSRTSEPTQTEPPQPEQTIPEPVPEPEPEPEPIETKQSEMEVDPAAEEEEEEEEEEEIEEEVEEEVEEEEEEEEEEDDEGEEQQQEQETLIKQSNGGPVTGGVENSKDGEELDDEPFEKLLEPFTKDQMVVLIKEAVSKHPDVMDSVRKFADADPAHRKIFVHGLGWDTTAETLTSVFGKYGEIEDCKAVTDKVSGKSKGYGFILYKHRSGARKALMEPQKKIGNRMTSCQ